MLIPTFFSLGKAMLYRYPVITKKWICTNVSPCRPRRLLFSLNAWCGRIKGKPFVSRRVNNQNRFANDPYWYQLLISERRFTLFAVIPCSQKRLLIEDTELIQVRCKSHEFRFQKCFVSCRKLGWNWKSPALWNL